MSSQSNVTSLVEKLGGDECLLTGPENILIPDGIYQASYMHFETSGMYARKIADDKSKLKGGKLYAWFQVDPYGEKLDNPAKVELYIPWNAAAVLFPIGLGGKFEMSRKGNYYKDYKRLFGVARSDRISPNAFKHQLWDVKVGTVERNEKQKKHSKIDRYSVIREIIRKTG